jgi:hypothetical protein
MFKPDKNFRMSKTYKRRLALMRAPKHIRDLWKQSFIQAQLAEEDYRRKKLNAKGE